MKMGGQFAPESGGQFDRILQDWPKKKDLKMNGTAKHLNPRPFLL